MMMQLLGMGWYTDIADHLRSILYQLHSDWCRSGQRVHGRSRHIFSWRSTLLQHKGEDLAGGAVDSQLIAEQSLADIVLRVAEVAGPADANLVGSALQAVLGACLSQCGEAEAEQGQSQSEYCRLGRGG